MSPIWLFPAALGGSWFTRTVPPMVAWYLTRKDERENAKRMSWFDAQAREQNEDAKRRAGLL